MGIIKVRPPHPPPTPVFFIHSGDLRRKRLRSRRLSAHTAKRTQCAFFLLLLLLRETISAGAAAEPPPSAPPGAGARSGGCRPSPRPAGGGTETGGRGLGGGGGGCRGPPRPPVAGQEKRCLGPGRDRGAYGRSRKVWIPGRLCSARVSIRAGAGAGDGAGERTGSGGGHGKGHLGLDRRSNVI